ncbi:hypothetical protein C5C31_09930 [Rathayibacter rathayi]|uniref:HepT-like ribonuclease domain-containing protein n=1 Tax=Rathayibacter rathayi TaxID=33887 RepID=UPI000CE78379|nr:HepT-like ribonuclease domain-containing protein [Rathayibacter rathayi]PPG68255.1 hypothetical protein C5C02_08420 [Rathayibacter rathayi]PPG76282.1 hypothetical protein C5C23_07900 [Rathayibacter rathayi]PPH21578.1 hypothetical protein C5C31_09930 [Rathayibacter rathayi]PPI76300.1 hypothetical protein C5E03_10250 [Rathayibacter rathayi]
MTRPNEGETTQDRFTARPRRPADDTGKRSRLILEADRLLSRLDRAARDGEDEFVRPVSDSRDIGALALITLAEFVHRDLPAAVVAQLPGDAVEGLRATRNIAAHNYAALDNERLWATLTVHAPALLRTIRAALLNG